MVPQVLIAALMSVPDLGIGDFVVKEDGKVREVLSVEPAVPGLQMVILVDDNGTAITYSRPASGGLPRKLEVTSPRPGVKVIAPTRVPVR